MYIVFSSIIFSFFFAFLFLMLFLFLKNKKIKTIFLILFLSISLAFNAFMYTEMVFNLTHPNIDKISKQTINYALENKLDAPIYVFRNYALKYYLEPKYGQGNVIQLDFKDEYDNNTLDAIKTSKGTVLVVDFPAINKQSDLWKFLSDKCTLTKSFEDKNENVGYVFSCE